MTLSHEEALNLLLANACPQGVDDIGEGRYFEFDLHCMMAKVTAELVSTVGTIQFKILRVELDPN